MTLSNFLLTLKGSSKSGNYGHGGRPGKRGGSSSQNSFFTINREDEILLSDYTGSAADMAEQLRTGRDLGKKIIIERMDNLIQRQPSLQKDVVLYRGLKDRYGFDSRKQFEVGKVFTEKAFSSTTSSEFIAKSFGFNVLLEIRVPAGSKILDVSKFDINQRENEFILPRNSKYKVVDVQKTSVDRNKVIVELVN